MINANVRIDANTITGLIKPMHGIGQPPMTGLTHALFHYLKEAGIPYSRLHDVGGWLGGGLYVDIPNLFRDFDADETDPASYDFTFTDRLIEGLMEVGCEPYFRLGVTIENEHCRKAYRIYPPKDFAKWARICEHVIRHYREGWANGYHYDITYWEIWNEPDDCYNFEGASMWLGTPEQFYELYSVAARHLKQCFGDSIKIGGYGHCGMYGYTEDPELKGIGHEVRNADDFIITFMHAFLRYQQETNAPIDFFTWHVYDRGLEARGQEFKDLLKHAAYCRKILDSYGFTHTEHHLNEWNMWTKAKKRDYPQASANTLACMLMLQNTSTDLLCFYDGGLGYSDYRGLINPDTGAPYRNYYAFASFNTLYRLQNQVLAECDAENLFVGAAKQGKRAAVVLSNTEDSDIQVNIEMNGFPTDYVLVHRIDADNRYTKTGETFGCGSFSIPANGCLELEFYDLQ